MRAARALARVSLALAWLASAPALASPVAATASPPAASGAPGSDEPLPPHLKKRRRIEAKQAAATAVTPGGPPAIASAVITPPTASALAATAVTPPASPAPARITPPPADHARWHRRLQARLGKPAAPPINIFHTWTHEYLVVDGASEIDQAVANRFFRCRFTGEPTAMDPRLFAALVAAARHFGVTEVHIVSAFRAPKYNLMLRKKGREVARDSQHTHGSAVDFRLPGVPVRKLHAWALRQRLGGVGLYVASGFIHMDTGRIRTWTGR